MPAVGAPRPISGPGAAAFLVFALSALLLWPGVATFDTLVQYGQMRSGGYDDWHPPAMARLWSLLHPLGGGQGPMFLLQLGLYWLGLGLVAARLPARTGWAVLALGAFPLFLAWQAVVLKDAQMIAALLAAVGLAGWWQLREARVPALAVLGVLLLLAYAALVRANGVFAAVPLGLALFDLGGKRPILLRLALGVAAIGAVIAVSGPINHDLLRAKPSGVERTLPLYDLAGIVHRAGPAAAPVLPAAEWRAMEDRRCYGPFLWDPLGDDTRCGFLAEDLDEAAPHARLVALWARAVATHPAAYAAHRLAHWNSTMRWIVPSGWPVAAPPGRSDPNPLGLGSPGPAMDALASAAGWLAEGPEGAPALWFVAALGALFAARGRSTPRQRLAFALALSAVALELGFLVVSIASDLRYHLWAMFATMLAWLLLAERPLPRGAIRLTLAALLLLGAPALAARLALPPGGAGYPGMPG
ncbi:MAG: hypothetical protein J7483_11190 [Novosphingobium sp.]|nr:hypothetical protein [Novosphingobium sp.]